MGAALSDARILLHRRRENGRPHPAGDGQARRPLDRRRASISSAPTRSTAAIGAPPSTTRSCISSSATTRPSTSRSPTSSRASKPARRASTNWRAATCRDHLFGPFHRQCRRCAGRWPTIWRASAPTSRRPARSLRRPRRSARIWSNRTRTTTAPGEAGDAELRPEQHLRQDPARRIALLQGLRGRQGARLPRHHAARAGPYAGAAQGPGAQYSRRRAGRSRACDRGGAEGRQGCDDGASAPTASPSSSSTKAPAARWCSTCTSTSSRARPASP